MYRYLKVKENFRKQQTYNNEKVLSAGQYMPLTNIK